MSDHIVCLGCGGAVDEGDGIPDGHEPCSCPPPSVEAKSVDCPTCGGPLRVGARACPFCHCTLASCRCGHCMAWNLAQAAHCQACGRAMQGDAVEEGRQKEHPCPRCDTVLVARRYNDLDVDECDSCGGLMITPTMMDRLVESRDKSTNLRLALPERPYEREQQVRYIKCPDCQKMMNRQAFGRISGVIVDVCKQHGVWFDPGELGQVLAFVERGGLERARERHADELAEQQRRLRSDQAGAAVSSSMSQAGALEHRRYGGQGTLATEFVRALAGLWS